MADAVTTEVVKHGLEAADPHQIIKINLLPPPDHAAKYATKQDIYLLTAIIGWIIPFRVVILLLSLLQ